MQLADEVDGHDDPGREVQPEVEPVVDPGGGEPLHDGFSASTQRNATSSSGSRIQTTSSRSSSKPASRTSRRFVSAGKPEKNISTPSHCSVRSGPPTWLNEARNWPPGFSQLRIFRSSAPCSARGAG